MEKIHETCLAGAGSLLVEFGLLSHLSGDSLYGELAQKSTINLINRRNEKTQLLGNTLDIRTGQWLDLTSGVGAGMDSFYEYLLKVCDSFFEIKGLYCSFVGIDVRNIDIRGFFGLAFSFCPALRCWQSINQSINLSIYHQSCSHLINQSINHPKQNMNSTSHSFFGNSFIFFRLCFCRRTSCSATKHISTCGMNCTRKSSFTIESVDRLAAPTALPIPSTSTPTWPPDRPPTPGWTHWPPRFPRSRCWVGTWATPFACTIFTPTCGAFSERSRSVSTGTRSRRKYRCTHCGRNWRSQRISCTEPRRTPSICMWEWWWWRVWTGWRGQSADSLLCTVFWIRRWKIGWKVFFWVKRSNIYIW